MLVYGLRTTSKVCTHKAKDLYGVCVLRPAPTCLLRMQYNIRIVRSRESIAHSGTLSAERCQCHHIELSALECRETSRSDRHLWSTRLAGRQSANILLLHVGEKHPVVACALLATRASSCVRDQIRVVDVERCGGKYEYYVLRDELSQFVD